MAYTQLQKVCNNLKNILFHLLQGNSLLTYLYKILISISELENDAYI